MKIPFLDLQAQYSMIRGEVRTAMDRVCDSQHFILGPEVAALEQSVRAVCGDNFGIGVSSGTDALLAALMAVGVGPGAEVITTAFSFFATAGVVARLQARPVFVDIEEHGFNLDPERVEAAVTSRTKAILPVHLFGRCAEMKLISDIADARGLHVIEDAAQAIGARDERGQAAGLIGSLGGFSFFPSKNLGGFCEGGIVVCPKSPLSGAVRVFLVPLVQPKNHPRLVGR